MLSSFFVSLSLLFPSCGQKTEAQIHNFYHAKTQRRKGSKKEKTHRLSLCSRLQVDRNDLFFAPLRLRVIKNLLNAPSYCHATTRTSCAKNLSKPVGQIPFGYCGVEGGSFGHDAVVEDHAVGVKAAAGAPVGAD
jgi:hypothetical protein